MITRPENLICVKREIEFNLRIYKVLEIDLAHINKNGRANYLVTDVMEIVQVILDGVVLESVEYKLYGKEYCDSFIQTGKHKQKRYKIVLCVCSDRPNSIGIITLHRLKG